MKFGKQRAYLGACYRRRRKMLCFVIVVYFSIPRVMRSLFSITVNVRGDTELLVAMVDLVTIRVKTN